MPTLLKANWDRWEAGVRAESREEGIRLGIKQGRAAEAGTAAPSGGASIRRTDGGSGCRTCSMGWLPRKPWTKWATGSLSAAAARTCCPACPPS